MRYDDESNDGLLVTGFMLGKATFGVDARLVQEVVKVGDVTRVHDAPTGVIGIRNLRGRIVTVLDMAVHLNLGCVEPGPETRMLIMEYQGESYGFLVDAVTDAIALEEDRIASPPASMDGALRERVRGVWREGDKLTTIIDADALFRWEDVAR
ncbi:MAG: chemotaxis protein CheW [bacterium]|nr:chemotaxis protein CheW [bacterium]